MQIMRTAQPRDAASIAALVNSANSGSGVAPGWTHEAALFDGDRTSAAEILQLMQMPDARFVLCIDGGEILGACYLKTIDDAGYMGLLAVRPALQARGIGKQLIGECERVVQDDWRKTRMLIAVITTHRPELTAFYERRGYARTGRYKEFERKKAQDSAKVAGLSLEWMEKTVGTVPDAR